MDIRNYISYTCKFKCNSCNQINKKICTYINRFESKCSALKYKYKIYKLKRNDSNTSDNEPDFMFEVYIAEHYFDSPNQILNDYNFIEDYKFDDKHIQRVNRIKRKIRPFISLYNINDGYERVYGYIDSIGFYTFRDFELDIYVKAIEYFYSPKLFTLSFVSNPHKKTTYNESWFNLLKSKPNLLNDFIGNDLYFLASFCKDYSIDRNVCTRLFTFFNNEKAFSVDDIEYILEKINKSYIIKKPITKRRFFNFLKAINNL